MGIEQKMLAKCFTVQLNSSPTSSCLINEDGCCHVCMLAPLLVGWLVGLDTAPRQTYSFFTGTLVSVKHEDILMSKRIQKENLVIFQLLFIQYFKVGYAFTPK